MFSTILLLLAVLVTFLVWKFVLKPLRLFKYYKQFEGAAQLPFIPLLGALGMLKPAYEKYGDMQYPTKVMYQTYPNAKFIITNIADKVFLSICDPEIIKDFYLNKEDNYAKLKLTYENMTRVFGHGVVFSEGKEWSRKRKIMTSMFHFEFFEKFYPLIEHTIDDMLNGVGRLGQMDSIGLSSRVAAEVIIKCFFGNFIMKTQLFCEPIAVSLSHVVSQNSRQNVTIWFMLFGAKFFDLGLRKIDRNLNQKIAIIRSIGRDAINSLMEQYSKKDGESAEADTNFVKMVIDKGYLNGKGELYITTEELIDEFFTFYIGGMDTTAHLMGMCLYYLSIYPDVQEKLRKQVSEAPDLTLNTLSQLHYLDSVVNETNRHYGFMPSIFPREALKDHQLGHIAVKNGTVVMLNWLGNYYYEKYFPNPTEFNPDRWVDGGKAVETGYMFTPFSAGKRVCVGKRLALIETKLLIAKAVKRFRIKLKQGYVHKIIHGIFYEPENPIPLLFSEI